MSRLDLIMAYEGGTASPRDVLDLFADLIRTGDAWTLPGSYGRTARALIGSGIITPSGDLPERALDALEN